jgi:capsular polysaccharide transport system permease protein
MTATYIHTKKKAGKSKVILRTLGLLYFVGLLLGIAYLWTMTQNRYESTASFKIARQNAATSEPGLAQLILPGISDSSSADSQLAIGFIDSADLLLELEKEFYLNFHYSSPKRDFFFRLPPDSPLEDRLRFYRSRIRAHYDTDTGLTRISVDTFDPKLSEQVTAFILKKSEVFINRLNQDIAQQQHEFITAELERAAKNVENANSEMLTFQNKYNIISPDDAIMDRMKGLHEMRMEQLKMTAEVDSLSRDSPNSPRLDTLRSRLRSINELIDIENTKLSGPEQDRLNQLLVQFKQLELRLEYAVKLRTGTQSLLEKNRVDIIARSRFFSVIQTPYLPEDITLPKRPYTTGCIVVLGFMLFLVLRALTHSIMERA